MAVTVTLVRATDHRLVYRLDYDGLGGAGGVALTIGTLPADAAGHQPILDAVNTFVANAAAAIVAMINGGACIARISGLGAATVNQWSVTADEAANLSRLVVTTTNTGTVAAALLDVECPHSIDV